MSNNTALLKQIWQERCKMKEASVLLERAWDVIVMQEKRIDTLKATMEIKEKAFSEALEKARGNHKSETS